MEEVFIGKAGITHVLLVRNLKLGEAELTVEPEQRGFPGLSILSPALSPVLLLTVKPSEPPGLGGLAQQSRVLLSVP